VSGQNLCLGMQAGTVTFLLTDIEGSTRHWESEPEAMEVALQRHDRLLAEVIEGHGGAVITSRGEGDSAFAVFHSAVSAVEAAGMCQRRLGREVWPADMALRVRMGLHTGEVQVRGGDHVDYTPINRCARVWAAGHGGHVLLTKATRDLVAGRLGSAHDDAPDSARRHGGLIWVTRVSGRKPAGPARYRCGLVKVRRRGDC
jgi:class 3 adenylate cyclase